MSTIVTRSGKGSPLTHNEVDANFTNLNSDKTENSAAAITGGSINNTVIGNTTPNAATFTTLTATGQSKLGGDATTPTLQVNALAGAARYLEVTGSTVGNVFLAAQSAVGSPGFVFTSRGSGNHDFTTGASTTNIQARISHTASAVNYVQVTGAATNNIPFISAQGSDASVALGLTAKSGSSVNFFTNNGTNRGLRIGHVANSVNYSNITGSASGSAPVYGVDGTDTNVSMAFQSKGTGGISLSTGSKGTNLVNGTMVTAITRTANGSGYTSIPSVALSAPTTAGGVQATVSLSMAVQSGAITVANGGTGYSVNDVLTVVGGTGTAAQIIVNTVSGGVITSASRSNTVFGIYTVLPTSPVSVTGGTGSGATFTLAYEVLPPTITNAGSGYVEQPTVTFSGGGGSGAAAYATVGSATVVRSLGSTVSFNTPAGESFRVSQGASFGAAHWRAEGSAVTPGLFASGNNGIIGTSGNGVLQFVPNNVEQFRVSPTASAVNYVQVTGGVTGGGIATSPTISSQGSDTNVSLNLNGKGNGGVRIGAQRTNFVTISGSGSGGGTATLTSEGGDTNIDLALTPKGTGLVRFGTYTGTALSIAGYIEIKDSGGTVRKLAVVA